MKPSRLLFSAMFFGAAILSQLAHAANDPNATVVKLRKSCEEVPGVTLNNCFNTTSALRTWINARPVSAGPLSIEIGPGTFGSATRYGGVFVCDKTNITLKGSGPEVTILDGTVGIIGSSSCINLNVQDLTVMVRFIGILWNGDSGGSSRWTNVNVKTESVDVSAGYLWWEGCGPASTDVNRASHYWFSSRLFTHNTANAAYAVHCSENWFFGSEIASEGTAILAAANANAATAKPEVHVYGSVIRVKPRPGFTTAPPAGVGDSFNGVIAVAAGRNADVHVHGTGIDVIGNELPNSIAALVAWDGGAIHANEAAFNLKPGIGKVTRIIKDTNPNTHVHAPYLWPEHATPPNITSVLGADMAVVTSTSDSRPHLVIYDSNCPSKWYDTADKLCRP